LFHLHYYSEMTSSPLSDLLLQYKVNDNNFFVTFTYSSWNNDIDTGRSKGVFLVFYMGHAVEHSSNILDPVALSSAEAGYNEACLACMLMHTYISFLISWSYPAMMRARTSNLYQ